MKPVICVVALSMLILKSENTLANVLFNVTARGVSPASITSDSMPRLYT